MAYNPASPRVRTVDGTVDLRGVVTFIFPNGTVVELGEGAVFLRLLASTGSSALVPFYPTQDSVNPRLWTIPGTDTWLASSITFVWNGAEIQPSLVAVGGTGNRTITLDPTVEMPLGSSDYKAVWGWGAKL